MTRLAAISAALAFLATTALAQELPGDSLGLIPEAPTTAAKTKAQPVAPKKKSSTEQASEDLKMRIHYREAKTKVLQDPKLHEEWNRAHAQRTEPERREALKSYYKLFCDRVEKADPSVKPKVEELRKSLTWRLEPGVHIPPKMVKQVDAENPDATDN